MQSAWSSEEIKYVKDYLKEQVGKKSPQRLLKELLDDEVFSAIDICILSSSPSESLISVAFVSSPKLWLKIAEILKKQRFTVNAKSPYHVKML
tara:strand:+ start:2034 stop:2312 length:279 start_codon:yes stop_codon:yes gene_type:complete